jgi:hypothetical protein
MKKKRTQIDWLKLTINKLDERNYPPLKRCSYSTKDTALKELWHQKFISTSFPSWTQNLKPKSPPSPKCITK